MSNESQLQNMISWAIPRYLENICGDKEWASFVPSNTAQSTVDPTASGFDVLGIVDALTFFLELKSPDFSKDPLLLTFNELQKEFLAALEASGVPVRVCYHTTVDFVYQSAPPSPKIAVEWLDHIRAALPSKINITKPESLRTFIDNILKGSQNGEAGDAGAANWTAISQAISDCYANDHTIPSNLLLIVISDRGVRCVPASSVKNIIEFSEIPAVTAMLSTVTKLGRLFRDGEASKRGALQKLYDNSISITLALLDEFGAMPVAERENIAVDNQTHYIKALLEQAQKTAKAEAAKVTELKPK